MRHLPLAALFVWAAAIFIASSIPNPPDAGGGEWKYEAAHFVEYAVFAALAVGALHVYFPGKRLLWVAITAWAIAVLYGMSDEFHQSFVPNRDANWLDVGFDALGAALGATVGGLVLRRRIVNREP